MASLEMAGDVLDPEDGPQESDEPKKKKTRARDEELSTDEDIKQKLLDLYPKIDKAYLDSADRINEQMDYWDIYNCDTGSHQMYQPMNADAFVPLIRDAVDARVTRFVNQIFPASGHNVEIVTPDGMQPFHLMALLEHYIDASYLRARVLPALLRNGDVEGHWNLYVSWDNSTRMVTKKVMAAPKLDDIEVPEAGEYEDIAEEEIKACKPMVEVIPDPDIVVIPAISDSIEEALARGGAVGILRRWSKSMIESMIDDGTFVESQAQLILDEMSGAKERSDTKKKHVDSAGIVSGGKYCLGYEVWTMLEIDDEKQLCVAYYGSSDVILGCRRNPYWCDLCPLISAPLDKLSGVFKGTSPIKKVAQLQYLANDYMNQGADSATFGLNPIIMTDPISNPRVGSMVVTQGAVWEVNPQTTQFAKFPNLWNDAIELVSVLKAQIFQSLGVNPSMIPGQVGGKSKKSQAEIANEQAVDILTTADVVTSLEAGVLTPLLQRFAWYDAQFRDEGLTVRAYGRDGMAAAMEHVPPVQMDTRYWFKWLGVEAARSAQQQQQNIALLNVLNGIPSQKYPGRKMDLCPLIERIVSVGVGARLAPKIFTSIKDEFAIPADAENEMLTNGFDLPTSPFDDDIQHLQEHQVAMAGGDVHGTIRIHIMKHVQQLQMKQQQQAMQQQGEPGKPGGAGPGVAGTPVQGGQPAGPRLIKSPPGAVHPDSMPLSMPRKM